MMQDESIAKISDQVEIWSEEQVKLIGATVAKGTSAAELALFLNVCKSVGLNPFNREIWCYKDHRGNLVMYTGRDGYLKIAQNNPTFNGMRSSEYCENDEISLDVPNGKVHHKIDPLKERGAIKGAYALVFRKAGEPTLAHVDIATYDKENPNFVSPWKTHKASMIKKVAETNALKAAYGTAMIQSRHEFEINETEGRVVPIDHSGEVKSEIDKLQDEFLEVIEAFPESKANNYRQSWNELREKDQLTPEMARSVIQQIRLEVPTP